MDYSDTAVTGTTFTVTGYTLGVPVSQTDPNNATTSAQYDKLGRLISLTRPGDENPSLTIAYTDSNPFKVTLTQSIDVGSTFSIERFYDGMGRQTKTIAAGITTTSAYDAYGHATSQSTPYDASETAFYTTSTYDILGRPLTVTTPDKIRAEYSYDGLSTTVSAKFLNGGSYDVYDSHTTSTTTDVWGRMKSVSPPTGTGPSVTYEYYENDQLKQVTQHGTVTTDFTYDRAGRKISMSDPDMGSWTYAYDALGNLIRQTDARGQRICLYYDSLSRLIGKHYRMDNNCPASPTFDVSYSYDSGVNGIGRRTGVTDDSGSTSWTYDVRGRMVSETKSLTGYSDFVTEWTYNSADLPVTMKYPDGEIVAYDYNARMLLEKLYDTNGTASNPNDDYYYVSSTLYDSAGRMTSRALGNTLTQNYNYYAWDEKATVDSVLVGQGGRLKNTYTGSLQDLSYLYDAAGNIKTITDTILSETQVFGYDPLDRLTSAVVATGPAQYSETYGYNSTTGRLETKAGVTLGYNTNVPVNAVKNTDNGTPSNTSDDDLYFYDANGNQIRSVVNGQSHVLEFDAENRLTKVCQDTSGNSICDAGETVLAIFIYDGDGRRVKATVDNETILFIGGHYEFNDTTDEVTKYYFAGASRIAMRKYIVPQNDTLTYLLGDHLGSTSLTTDETGTLLVETRYKAWGEVRYTTPNSTLPTRYTYTGQYSYMNDEATDLGSAGFDLMYYNARFYSPYINHFIQPDTIIPNAGNPQSWNRYSYVGNNPIRYTDPTGHKACGSVDSYGGCDDKEEKVFKLVDYVEQHLMNKNKTGIKGKHTSLGAMLTVVNKAAHIFGKDWDGFLDATTYVFTGYAGHGSDAMWSIHKSGKIGLIGGTSGFHPDFQDVDGSQQVRHFWAGFATAVNPNGNNPFGVTAAIAGNNYHDYYQDTRAGNDGVTIMDYKLTVTAIDIASQVGDQIKTPSSLASVLESRLGINGPGYIGPQVDPAAWYTPYD